MGGRSGAYPTITDCLAQQNHTAELIAFNEAGPTVRNCHFRYSTEGGGGVVDDGLVFSGLAQGVFRHNRVQGVGYAVLCLGGSNPSFNGEGTQPPQKYGQNDILDFRNYGVLTLDQSYPVFGLGDGTGQGGLFEAGRNNIYSTRYPGAVFISHAGPSTLNAQWCFWNDVAVTDTMKFKGTPINASNVLTSFDPPGGPGWYYPGYQNAAPLGTSSADLLVDAVGKEATGDLDGAVTAYKDLVAAYPSSEEAIQAVGRLVPLVIRRGSASGELAYAATLDATNMPAGVRGISRWLVSALRTYPPVLLRTYPPWLPGGVTG